MQNETPDLGPLAGLPVWVSDSNNSWPSLRIARSVPLGRLEWLWKSRGASIRDSSTIARAFFEVSNAHQEPIPALQNQTYEWYRNPHVYILVTTLKELDDSKDFVAWERIRHFLDSCREELHEYLIIVAATDQQAIYHRRLLEKLRTEVNLMARGRERVVVVPPASIKEEMRPITHLHHSPSHQDLLVRLRECMRDAVEARIRSYEDEVSRSYLNKSSSSWSFPKFFIMKEGMAFVFVQLGRRDLAVKLYDELHGTMTEQGYLKTKKFCDQTATEAADGISNPDARDYRTLLVKDSATELDMRTYLFARQLSFLLMDRKFSEVAERGLKFITTIARRCAEESLKETPNVSTTFRDSWVFTTARTLAAALAPAIPSQAEASHLLSTQLSSSKERHIARLIAGFHVHALKAFLGLAHVVFPGCLSANDSTIPVNREAMVAEATNTTDEKLKNGLSDRKKAEILHSEMANAAASLYEIGGRARGAAALDGDAGMVCLKNKSYAEGESLLAAQCSRFASDNGWDELHLRSRTELAKAEKELDRVQEYLVSCLTLLYMSRESRMLGSRPTVENGQEAMAPSNADKWTKEVLKTAARLPRVMKYKASRLFEVSVRPNPAAWNEGDCGSAIVEVKSDLPTSVTLDRITMECKCAEVDAHRKSAFHIRSPANSPSSSPKANVENTQTPMETSERPELFTLSAEGSITINPGANRISVECDEIPHHGLCKVTSVALFIGKLKLQQAAAKVPMHQVVTTKHREGGKGAPSPPHYPMLADLTDCDVRFPIFFASPRKPSASLFIENRKPLYLAPQSVQYIQIRIQAGEHGVVKGSRLAFSLLNAKDTSPDSEVNVQFASTSQGSLAETCPVLPIAATNSNEGDATLDRDLGPNESLEGKVALQVSNEEGCVQQGLEYGTNYLLIILRIQLSCRERDGNVNRPFSCVSEATLSFHNPVEVSAHIQMLSSWGGDSIKRAVALDGTPLMDGGSLLCNVMSRVSSKDILTLKKAVLQNPAWLELRPDEVPAHEDLLPIELGRDSSFSCVFDVLEREQSSLRCSGRLDDSSPNFGTDPRHRRGSRIHADALESTNHQAASQDWNEEPPEDDTSSSSEGLMEQLAFAARSATPVSDRNNTQMTLEHTDRNSDASIDDLGADLRREAEDVVDLSTSGEVRIRSDASESTNSLLPNHTVPRDLATLRLFVEISGMEGISCLERKISMESFRTAKKRFRVERTIKSVGQSGEMMRLSLQVRSVGEGRSYHDGEEETTLQYEVDANPQIWLVIGRRRGKFSIYRGTTVSASVSLVPLTCGWHRVPCLRLFTKDGIALPFSSYENVDECKEVVVVPCGTAIGGCAIDDEVANNGNVVSRKGTMPVVIASDSFFGS